MLDIGWTEMAFIAVIALIVIGPKDLPKAMRTVSKWVRKARSLAREFQSGLDDIARDTDLDEVKKQLTGDMDFDLGNEIENTIDPEGTVKQAMDLSEEMDALESDPEGSHPEIAPPEIAHGDLPSQPETDFIPPLEDGPEDGPEDEAQEDEAQEDPQQEPSDEEPKTAEAADVAADGEAGAKQGASA